MNNIASAINQFKASFLNNSGNQQNNRSYKPERFSHPFDPEESEPITNNVIDDLSALIPGNNALKVDSVEIDDLIK